MHAAVGSEGERALETLLRFMGWPQPVREHRFDPSRKWRADFAWPDRMLLVEIEGGTFVAGRHSRGRGFEADCEKLNAAVIAGWRVLRFTTEMVTSGVAIETLEKVFG